jgi:glycerol-3-phosphate dehydrogenase
MDRKLNTWEVAIGGSQDYPENLAQRERLLHEYFEQSGLNQTLVEGLFGWYGTKTAQILSDHTNQLRPLQTIPGMTKGELIWILMREDVLHLDDLILRRTVLAKLGEITPESLEEIAAICAEVLGWSPEQKTQEIKRYQRIMLENHRLRFGKYVPRHES